MIMGELQRDKIDESLKGGTTMEKNVMQGETLEDKIWEDFKREEIAEALEADNEMWIETQPHYEEYEAQFKKE